MDLDKLCKEVMAREEMRDIPVLYVMEVIMCVFDVIGTGECFYITEFD